MKKTIVALMLAVPLLAGAAYAQHLHGGAKDQAAKKEAAPAEKKETPAARKVTAEEVGKDAACAVTGEKLKIAEDTISMSYKGKNYYFCCPGCDKRFAAAPERFTAKKPAQAKVYACPMGDYKGDKPGKCPKCGMNLAEQKPAAAAKKYACPMGDYEGDKPGKCPKCGMTLVEKK